MKSFFVASIALLLSLVPLLAQTTPPSVSAPVVPSGKERQVGFFTSINPDCTGAGDIERRLIKEPKNGKVELEQGPGFPTYPPNNPRNICNTKQVQGIRIKYTSKDGFVGKDAFDVEFLAPLGGDYIWKYSVTVK
jgi:hypothetical protein